MDIVEYYLQRFRPGMIDLSASSPPLRSDGAAGGYAEAGGLRALRTAIARRYPGLTAENVVVTSGASEALAATALALIGRGDRVDAVPGTYPSFLTMANRLGADLRTSHPDTFAAPLALVNNPSTPDGRLVDMAALLANAGRAGRRVVADEVYLTLGQAGTHAPLPAASLSPSAISIADLSKPLGLGGLRIGWVATRDQEALSAISAQVQLVTGGPSIVAMEQAVAAFETFDVRLDAHRAMASANGGRLFRLLEDHGWRICRPEAGTTFVAAPPSPLSASDLVLIQDGGLFVVPTDVLGAPGGIRLSLFADPRAVARLIAVCSRRSNERVVVLAKAPWPGVAKTRLAQSIGGLAAARIARAFIDDTITLAGGARSMLIAYAPSGARAAFADLADGAQLVGQPEGDLGDRIASALRAALADAGRAVLIGTDTPDLQPTAIEQAFTALRSSDLVLGPAEDGGFYLIGCREPLPAGLFDGVAWSTRSVCARVVANAERLGLTVAMLEPWADVDDLAGLRHLADRMESHRRAPATRAALTELGLAREMEASHGA